ncbi:hypothetical protein ERO13_D10G133432v2 [Gossypium hirsutum]|nr:hypothetical protein ERO13_D10G133432v2 [Gossypium hirsutum]
MSCPAMAQLLSNTVYYYNLQALVSSLFLLMFLGALIMKNLRPSFIQLLSTTKSRISIMSKSRCGRMVCVADQCARRSSLYLNSPL